MWNLLEALKQRCEHDLYRFLVHLRPKIKWFLVATHSLITLHSPDDLAPVAKNEGQTAVFKRRHGERVCVVVEVASVFFVQHALQKALAQRQQVRQGVLFAEESNRRGRRTL